MSLGQFVPHHPQMLSDNLIGQFKCPYHDDSNPHYFVLKENCAEHIKTHKNPKPSEPIDRLDGMNCKNLGVYTCNYCRFKTNSLEYAQFHLKAVHEKHLIKPNTADNGVYNWKKNVNLHFKICGSNEAYSRGNFECSFCELSFPKTGDVIQHLVSSSHIEEYKNATNGIIKNELLTAEIATKALELINKYKTTVYTDIKGNKDDTNFLKVLVKKATKNTKNWFWRIPNNNGEYRNEGKCYQNKNSCFDHIARYKKMSWLMSFCKMMPIPWRSKQNTLNG